jgi:hypothetical protein
MKLQHIHQEVLVSTTSTLATKVLQEINDNNKSASSVEKFEEACWNGLLNEMFPKLISIDSTAIPKMFIWRINTGKFSLLIDLADTHWIMDSMLSIDPYLFLSELNLN